MEYVKISSIKLNPANPRIIRDEKYRKLVQSVAQFPAMLDVRGVVVDGQKMILGGNQRWRAILDILKMPESDLKQACGENETAYALFEVLREKKSVPAKWVLDGSKMTPDEIRRFIIADNVEFGEHDWDALANGWDAEELSEWGLDVPGFGFSQDGLGDAFSLPDGDREPFRQMTFTLADAQYERIMEAIALANVDPASTHGNQNGNGNALHQIVLEWEGRRI